MKIVCKQHQYLSIRSSTNQCKTSGDIIQINQTGLPWKQWRRIHYQESPAQRLTILHVTHADVGRQSTWPLAEAALHIS
jgi:hypothetical protein